MESVLPMTGDATEALLNRTWRPTLSVIGAEGFPAPQDSGNVLRPYTAFKLSLRLPPLVDAASAVEDSFVGGLLDCPHYTRPEVYEGVAVPDVLISGDHKKIRRWRLKQSLARTRKRRPDLLAHRVSSAEETQLLTEISGEEQCGE